MDKPRKIFDVSMIEVPQETSPRPEYLKRRLKRLEKRRGLDTSFIPQYEGQENPTLPKQEERKESVIKSDVYKEPSFEQEAINEVRDKDQNIVNTIKSLQNVGNPIELIRQFTPEVIKEKVSKFQELATNYSDLVSQDPVKRTSAYMNNPVIMGVIDQWKDVMENQQSKPLNALKLANTVASTVFTPVTMAFELAKNVPIAGEPTVDFMMKNFNTASLFTQLVTPNIKFSSDPEEQKQYQETINNLVPIAVLGLEGKLKSKGLFEKSINDPTVIKEMETFQKDFNTALKEQITPLSKEEATKVANENIKEYRQQKLEEVELKIAKGDYKVDELETLIKEKETLEKKLVAEEVSKETPKEKPEEQPKETLEETPAETPAETPIEEAPLPPTEQRNEIAKLGRHELPEVLDKGMLITAKDFKEELEHSGKHSDTAFMTNINDNPNQAYDFSADTKVFSRGITLSYYPDWFSELGRNRKDVLKAIEKIIEDNGKDKGKLVEEVKKQILDSMQSGRESAVKLIKGGITERGDPIKSPPIQEVSDFLNDIRNKKISAEQLNQYYKDFLRAENERFAPEAEKLIGAEKEYYDQIAEEYKDSKGIMGNILDKLSDPAKETVLPAELKRAEFKGEVQENPSLENVKTLREIGSNLVKNLGKEYGKDVRTGLIKRFHNRAEGLYFKENEIVRVKNLNDVDVLSHELGHALDYEVFRFTDKFKDTDRRLRKEMRNELSSLSDYASKNALKGNMQEPVAEFIKYYITDPEYAKKQAPKFYDMFEGIVKPEEKIYGTLLEAQRQIKEYSRQDPRQITESMIKREKEEGWLKGIVTQKKDPQGFLIDHTKIFEKLTDEIKINNPDLKTKNSPYHKVLSLIGVDGKAEKLLKYGNENTKGLLQILNPVVKEGRFKEVEGYLSALRNLELSKRGLTNAMTTSKSVAEKTVELYEQQLGKDKLRKIQEELSQYNKELLTRYLESGKISVDTYKQILEDNKFYIPFKRYFDELETSGKYEIGKLLSDSSPSPVKKISGSLREIVSPFESIIKNTYDILVSADRNETLSSIVKGLKTVDKTLVQEIPPKSIKRSLVLDKGVEEKFTLDYRKPENAEIVTVWVNGKPKYYQIPKEFYDSYFALQAPVGRFTKMMNIPTRILQGGAVVYDPSFTVTNISRDQMGAFFYSRYGYVPYLDWFKGMTSFLKKDTIYKKFLESGADQSFLTSMDKMLSKSYLERKLGKHAEDYSRYARRYTKNPLELLQDLNRLSELGTRIGAFKKAYSKTGDMFKAMEEARQISGDYGVKGKGMRNASLMYAFLNPRLQHLKLTAESLTGKRGAVVNKVAKGLTAVTLPAIMNWYLINSNPDTKRRFDEMPDWRKYTFFNIPIPYTESFLPVPKGFFGTLFGTSAEKLLDYANGEDNTFIKDLSKYLFQEVSPLSSFVDVFPTALRPVVEQLSNKQSFTGAPVVPERLLDVEPSEQFKDNTPQLYVALGRKLGISPLRIEALINGYTAGTGRNIVNIGDELLEAGNIIPDDDVTSFRVLGVDLTKMPVTKKFISEDFTGLRGENVRKFYDKLTELEKINKTVNRFLSTGEENRLAGYLSQNGKEYKYYIENQTNINKFKNFLTVARDISKEGNTKEINDVISKVASGFEKKIELNQKFDLNELIENELKEKKIDEGKTEERKKALWEKSGIEKTKKRSSRPY